MKSEQWRPLLGFALVSVLCAVLTTVSATRGFGLDLFRPGRPIAAPRVAEPPAARPTPTGRAPMMVPAELRAVPPTVGAATRATRPQASRSSWTAGRAVDTPGTRSHGAPVPAATTTPTPTPTPTPTVPVEPTTKPGKEAEKAQRDAEREAEKAQREAEREAEKAQREAEREAEKAQREAEREAEKAQREAEREAEKAQRDAEREAEKAQRDAERVAEDQAVQTTSDRTAS